MVRSGYFASLYFWIDLAATLSMLLDITRLMDLIFNQSTMAGSPALTRLVQNKVMRCHTSIQPPMCDNLLRLLVDVSHCSVSEQNSTWQWCWERRSIGWEETALWHSYAISTLNV